MKAIMINSQLKKVYNCNISENSKFRKAELYNRLECKIFAVGYTFKKGDALFINDEGMLNIDKNTTFFQIGDSQILAGNGVIIGPEIVFVNGSCKVKDVTLSIEHLKVNFFTIDNVTLPNKEYNIYGFKRI